MVDVAGIFRIIDVAAKGSKLVQAGSVISRAAISANALAKLGDVARLADFTTTNGGVDEVKLRKAGFVVQTISGQQVIKIANEDAISEAIAASLKNVPTANGGDDVVRVPAFVRAAAADHGVSPEGNNSVNGNT